MIDDRRPSKKDIYTNRQEAHKYRKYNRMTTENLLSSDSVKAYLKRRNARASSDKINNANISDKVRGERGKYSTYDFKKAAVAKLKQKAKMR